MRIEVGTWLKPKNVYYFDGTYSRVYNLVVKNNKLDRLYCVDIISGVKLHHRKINVKDLNKWVTVEMLEPSKQEDKPNE